MRKPMQWRAAPGIALLAVLLLAVAAPGAQAQPTPAVIIVTWSGDGKTVNITSTRDVSNIIIADCEGNIHKHEFEPGPRILTHSETFVIATIWVKAGSNSDPNGPPGAGQRFDNPNAQEQCDEEGGGSACEGPTNVTAVANENETVTVSWDGVADADSYNIYRAIGAGTMTFLASTTGTSYLDENVTNGVTYSYNVTAVIEGDETDACETAQVTAIPDLPGVFAMALASAGGLAAYALVRRRRS